MGAALSAGLAIAGDWYAMSSLARVGALTAFVTAGAAVYFGACYLVGLRVTELRIRSVA
jgi:hypothetical protein